MRFVESGGRALTSTSLTVPHCAKSSSSSGAGRDQGRLATYSFRRFSCSAAGAACASGGEEAATAAAAAPGKRRRKRCWRRGERSGRRGGANWETRGAGSAAAGWGAWGLRASGSAAPLDREIHGPFDFVSDNVVVWLQACRAVDNVRHIIFFETKCEAQNRDDAESLIVCGRPEHEQFL